jgi:phosphoglycerate dehydrogenase-like enzyme
VTAEASRHTAGPGVVAMLLWEPTPAERRHMRDRWPAGVEFVTRAQLERERRPAAGEVQIAVGSMRDVDPDLLGRAPRLELIHTLGHGVDLLLTGETGRHIHARGIKVAKANAAGPAIAEFVIMSMIALSRRVLTVHEALAGRGDWSADLKAKRAEGALGGELSGSVLALLGVGSIGREIAVRGRAMGMTVHGLVRTARLEHDELLDAVWTAPGLDSMLAAADYVVLNLPLTDATWEIMNADRFAAMKRSPYLVNVGRGRLIEERALYDALRSERLKGAALDVWYDDGPQLSGYPSEHPLHQFNVLMTPHYAGSTMEARARAFGVVGDNIRRWQAGAELVNLVDPRAGF